MLAGNCKHFSRFSVHHRPPIPNHRGSSQGLQVPWYGRRRRFEVGHLGRVAQLTAINDDSPIICVDCKIFVEYKICHERNISAFQNIRFKANNRLPSTDSMNQFTNSPRGLGGKARRRSSATGDWEGIPAPGVSDPSSPKKDPLALARQRKQQHEARSDANGVPKWKKKLLDKKRVEKEAKAPVDVPAWKKALLERKRQESSERDEDDYPRLSIASDRPGMSSSYGGSERYQDDSPTIGISSDRPGMSSSAGSETDEDDSPTSDIPSNSTNASLSNYALKDNSHSEDRDSESDEYIEEELVEVEEIVEEVEEIVERTNDVESQSEKAVGITKSEQKKGYFSDSSDDSSDSESSVELFQSSKDNQILSDDSDESESSVASTSGSNHSPDEKDQGSEKDAVVEVSDSDNGSVSATHSFVQEPEKKSVDQATVTPSQITQQLTEREEKTLMPEPFDPFASEGNDWASSDQGFLPEAPLASKAALFPEKQMHSTSLPAFGLNSNSRPSVQRTLTPPPGGLDLDRSAVNRMMKASPRHRRRSIAGSTMPSSPRKAVGAKESPRHRRRSLMGTVPPSPSLQTAGSPRQRRRHSLETAGLPLSPLNKKKMQAKLGTYPRSKHSRKSKEADGSERESSRSDAGDVSPKSKSSSSLTKSKSSSKKESSKRSASKNETSGSRKDGKPRKSDKDEKVKKAKSDSKLGDKKVKKSSSASKLSSSDHKIKKKESASKLLSPKKKKEKVSVGSREGSLKSLGSKSSQSTKTSSGSPISSPGKTKKNKARSEKRRSIAGIPLPSLGVKK